MRLVFHAMVGVDVADPPGRILRWVGIKVVDRPYGRVPVMGESVRLGDAHDSLLWPVGHVAWNNSGTPLLTLSFDEDDPTFDDIGVVEALEWFGFQRLETGLPTD